MPPFELDSRDLLRLRRLAFAARVPTLVHQEGQRRTRRAGEGMEFLDYRPYMLGDDVRHIDWNLYGRLRQVIVRVFEKQQNLSVSILVDVSRSMSFGTPVTKSAHACRIAAALSYVALAHGERVSVAGMGDELGEIVGPLQRKNAFGRVVEYLRQVRESAATRLEPCAKAFCAQLRHRGLIILLSDFLVPDGYGRALKTLLSRGNRLLVVQVQDPIDWGESLKGHFRLRDSETGEERMVHVDDVVCKHLKRAVTTHGEALATYCRNHGQLYLQTSTRDDYLEVVCHALRLEGGTG